MIDPYTDLSEEDQAEIDRQMADFAFDGLIEGEDGRIYELGEQTLAPPEAKKESSENLSKDVR